MSDPGPKGHFVISRDCPTQNLGLRFCACEMYLSPPPPPVTYTAVSSIKGSLVVDLLVNIPPIVCGGSV